jgi:hypothetical protein
LDRKHKRSFNKKEYTFVHNVGSKHHILLWWQRFVGEVDTEAIQGCKIKTLNKNKFWQHFLIRLLKLENLTKLIFNFKYNRIHVYMIKKDMDYMTNLILTSNDIHIPHHMVNANLGHQVRYTQYIQKKILNMYYFSWIS